MPTPMKCLLACLVILLAPATLRADDPPPKGEVKNYTFSDSKIFPGTTRGYSIYVPQQYDPAKPACVHIHQDGIPYNSNNIPAERRTPAILDNLIAKKEIPVIIGVFVAPGVVKATSPGALDRFNRSFEYDGLGDAYARFLLEELLPDVEKKTTSDGRAIKLSKDGNDRSIGGASSGAIAAFTAAWERPNDFRRVFSAIGTYVGLRGGNVYPTLIRKYEPKPIRVFLQDGSNDLNSFGGDWWMANQEMERALKFAGYEVEHVWGEGGHDGAAAPSFPDAMKFLWKGWPEAPKTGQGSQQLKDILVPGEGWQLVGEGYKFTEGPVVNAKGEVFFNDIPESKTWKVGLDGSVSPYISDSKRANGAYFGADGRMYMVATGTQQVIAYDADLKPTVLAEGIAGNDLIVRHDGGIYVTNPGGTPPNASRVWYISPGGEKKVVDTGLGYANGVTLSPDQSLLYVADMRSHWVYSYVIQPDGSLIDKQKYYHLHVPDSADDAQADGIRADAAGRLYVATRMGIQVCDQPGRVNAIIPTPNGKSSNLCLGGENFDTLYVTAGDKVFKRKLKVKGANAFQPPIKPGRPQL
jgi:gluconolactonase